MRSTNDGEMSDTKDKISEIRKLLSKIDEDSEYSEAETEQKQKIDRLIKLFAEIEEEKKYIFKTIFDADTSKERLRKYLSENKHDAIKSKHISEVAAIKNYSRRIRELRNEEGYVIATTRTNAELSPDEYLLVEVRDTDDKRRISAKQRDEYLDKQPSCEKCGFNPQEHNSSDVSGNRYVEVDHIKPYEEFDDSSEANKEENLQTLCNVCHNDKGKKNDRWN